MKMKQIALRGVTYASLGLAMLFLLRLGYGYLAYPATATVTSHQPSSFEFSTKNYATAKYGGAKGAHRTASALDQKYEKVADLRLRTKKFETAESNVRKTTTELSGLIQFERREGLAGRRTLHLAVGINPSQFDTFVDRVRSIGNLSYIQIQKHDRTNDFKELGASRISLQETQDSLAALKGKGGSIKELVELEDRILELRRQIHNLGIKLGEFEEDSEFCTVKISLAEQSIRATQSIPIWKRTKRALEWSIHCYLRFLLILVLGAILSLLALLLTKKIGTALSSIDSPSSPDSQEPDA